MLSRLFIHSFKLLTSEKRNDDSQKKATWKLVVPVFNDGRNTGGMEQVPAR